VAAVLLLASCASSSSHRVVGGATVAGAGAGSGKVINIVAGESFWGSVSSQLGGAHVRVTSIVTDPNTDPHEYESNTADARAFAEANYVVLNGAGYDSWGDKLLSANRASQRKVLKVADLLGKHAGDNPHFWYGPDFVTKVADRISADLAGLDPADASYLREQRAGLDTALGPYRDRIAAIRARFSGVKVGASETIFVYMAQALGLDLISPPAFMQAMAEGNDPPAPAVAQFQDQVSRRQIAVLVLNVQTTSAVTSNLKSQAAARGIPVVGISETAQPADASFQSWQVAQLVALQDALTRASAAAPGGR
jgi:zinc/manganese transport system substrate-binding protein